jgi:selenocysteine lyase/cysteine desulfurase
MARNIICSVRNGWLRVSPHFYNSEEEIQRIIDETALFYNS